MNEIKYTVLENNNLKIENLSNSNIIFRNFSGRAGTYNKEGEQKFTLVINSPEDAQRIASYGWNVKIRPPRNDGDEPFCTLEVRIRWDIPRFRPKAVKMFTRNGSVRIDETSIKNFDNVEFETVDLVLRPHLWSRPGGQSGISAQLVEMYARIQEGVLESKWAEEESPDDDEPF